MCIWLFFLLLFFYGNESVYVFNGVIMFLEFVFIFVMLFLKIVDVDFDEVDCRYVVDGLWVIFFF